MRTATFHVITGPIGAGKTTLALELAKQTNGVHFSIDDWMTALFGPDMKGSLDPAWIFERAARCQRQILQTGLAIGARKVDVVLDIGLTTAADRSVVLKVIQENGFLSRLHFLDVDRATRWQRVERRNQEQGPTFRLIITPAMFDFMESHYESPASLELDRWNG